MIEVSDHYQYLGINLCPSGSMKLAEEKLRSKAKTAWFSISNILYKNKRMHVEHALQNFDSLLTPVALYATELWLPGVIHKKSLKTEDNLLNYWEEFGCINQRMCRILLSVHKNSSRLAVLGELGRYPLFVAAHRWLEHQSTDLE